MHQLAKDSKDLGHRLVLNMFHLPGNGSSHLVRVPHVHIKFAGFYGCSSSPENGITGFKQVLIHRQSDPTGGVAVWVRHT